MSLVSSHCASGSGVVWVVHELMDDAADSLLSVPVRS